MVTQTIQAKVEAGRLQKAVEGLRLWCLHGHGHGGG